MPTINDAIQTLPDGVRYPDEEHDGVLVEATDANDLPETDPAWAGWWAECTCGWETFEPDRDGASTALDDHLGGLA